MSYSESFGKEVTNLLNIVILDNVMHSVDDERDASEWVLDDILAQAKEIVSYFRQILVFDTCSQLNDKHHVGLSNKFRG